MEKKERKKKEEQEETFQSNRCRFRPKPSAKSTLRDPVGAIRTDLLFLSFFRWLVRHYTPENEPPKRRRRRKKKILFLPPRNGRPAKENKENKFNIASKLSFLSFSPLFSLSLRRNCYWGFSWGGGKREEVEGRAYSSSTTDLNSRRRPSSKGKGGGDRSL